MPDKNLGLQKEMKSSENGKMTVNLEDTFFLIFNCYKNELTV